MPSAPPTIPIVSAKIDVKSDSTITVKKEKVVEKNDSDLINSLIKESAVTSQ